MHSSVPSRRARRALWRWAAAFLFLAATHPTAQAGGPLGLTPDGQPYRWDSSSPVRYIVDAGPLGPRSHAAAVAMVERAFQAWKNVPTARLQFESAGELPQDITGDNVMGFLDGLQDGDPCPILFDSDGSITETLAGQGASQGVLGFTVPSADPQSGQMLVNFTVLNGLLGASFSDAFALLTCTHELGHLVGLDHSQINGETQYDGDPTNDDLSPVMSYFRGPNGSNKLHRDEVAWFSWLYPSADFAGSAGTIRGRVLLPDGVTGLEGVNVIARRAGDPRSTAVSVVSGYAFQGTTGGLSDPARLGEFMIPGLPPGSYTLELQELQASPTVRVPHAYLIGGPKLWREGSSAEDAPTASTPIVVSAGQAVSGIDVIVNGEDLGAPKSVAAQYPNALPNPQKVSLPAVISGAVEDGVGDVAGPPITSDADLQDVYQVTLSEWTTVTAILSAADTGVDLDLFVLGQSGSRRVLEGASTQPGTPPEVVQLRLAPGKHFFGVHRAGDQGSAYTLRLLATPAPEPNPEPELTFISYLLVGDVTTTSATVRWQTTAAAPSVIYYDQPFREIGSPARGQEHRLSLTGLASARRTRVEAYASSDGGVDQVGAPLATASAPAPDGAPRIVAGSSAALLETNVAEVTVQLSNPGEREALKVRIEQVVLPAGWELLGEALTGTGLPDALDVGRIGAGGAGALVVRIVRRSGNADPNLTVHGSYADAAGTPLKF